MILRALSLAFLVALFCFGLSNQQLMMMSVESLTISADVSEVVFETSNHSSLIEKKNKPTFMQLEKINQHELPAQARIGYLLSRGF